LYIIVSNYIAVVGIYTVTHKNLGQYGYWLLICNIGLFSTCLNLWVPF